MPDRPLKRMPDNTLQGNLAELKDLMEKLDVAERDYVKCLKESLAARWWGTDERIRPYIDTSVLIVEGRVAAMFEEGCEKLLDAIVQIAEEMQEREIERREASEEAKGRVAI